MKSLYLKIADEIAEEIKNGHFPSGTRLYSRQEICTKFETSGQTAVRAQNALTKMGFVRKIRGSGMLSNYRGSVSSSISPLDTHLKRIVFFAYAHKYIEEFQTGARERSEELNLDFRIEYINISEHSKNVFSAYPVEADEGYIAVSTGAKIHFATGALLFSPSVKSSLIDYITPGSSCVITDNFDGIRQLVNHGVSCGCQRFIFAKAGSIGPLNMDERTMAFNLEMKYRDLNGFVSESGNFDDIIENLNSQPDVPTAVLFPQDDPALRFKKRFTTKMPLITGFDDFTMREKGLEHLTTIHVNRHAMGAAAVDTLYESGYDLCQKIVRIPGTLIVRD